MIQGSISFERPLFKMHSAVQTARIILHSQTRKNRIALRFHTTVSDDHSL